MNSTFQRSWALGAFCREIPDVDSRASMGINDALEFEKRGGEGLAVE